MAFKPSIAHITSDGFIYQVLDQSQENWDEAKTAQSITDDLPVAQIVNGVAVEL